MEERKCCSSKEHGGSENKVKLHQFDSGSERERAYETEKSVKRLRRVRRC